MCRLGVEPRWYVNRVRRDKAMGMGRPRGAREWTKGCTVGRGAPEWWRGWALAAKNGRVFEPRRWFTTGGNRRCRSGPRLGAGTKAQGEARRLRLVSSDPCARLGGIPVGIVEGRAMGTMKARNEVRWMPRGIGSRWWDAGDYRRG